MQRQDRHVRHLLGRLQLPPDRDPRARAPKAIVTVCSTDDRYDNDAHHMGGSVLAADMRAWDESAGGTGIAFEKPEQAEPLGVNSPPHHAGQTAPGVLVVVDPRYGGTRVHPHGLGFTEDALETYPIDRTAPLSARTRSARPTRPAPPGADAGGDGTGALGDQP